MRYNRKNITLSIISSLILMGIIFLNVSASGSIEPERQNTNGTDVVAGVVVDYMGKLKFHVMDKDTLLPIKDALIERYVKGTNSYVLCGISDEEGNYEMDVVYSEDNIIKWKVYKAGYLKYPEMGDIYLNAINMPYQQDVYLYKETSGDNRNKSTDGKGIKTGDSMALAIYIALTGTAFGIVVIQIIVAKKRDKKNKYDKNQKEKDTSGN